MAMRPQYVWLVFAAAVPALAVGAADDYYATVANLIERVDRLEKRLSGPALAEMVGQSDALRGEIRELRGDMEQLTHEIDQIKEQQRQQYLDLDQRIQALSAGKPPSALKESGSNTSESEETGKSANAEAAKQAYAKAFASLKDGHYPEAAGLFKRFLADYPDDPQAAAAQYWLGEAHYVARELSVAREAFRKLLEAYPKSDKAADAALRLGYIEYDSQKWAEAARLLKDVTQRYPGSKAAQSAQQRLQKMKQEGH